MQTRTRSWGKTSPTSKWYSSYKLITGRFLTSELFTLVPSGSSTKLKIHQALLKSISPALRSTSEGGWAETKSGTHKFLEDNTGNEAAVTESVLVCFISWSYAGDYRTETVGVSARPPQALVEAPEEDDDWVFRATSTIARSTKGSKNKNKLAPPVSSTSTNEPVTPPHLHHLLLNVQIYVFANIYLLPELSTLAQQKIIAYSSLNQTDEVDAVFDALDYAIIHLPEDDELLDWFAKYASWKLDILRTDMGRLNTLMKKSDGKFAGLVIKHVSRCKVSPFKK